MSAAIENEMLCCPAEDGAHCDVMARELVGFTPHCCTLDDGHDGAHECACGHRWGDDDGD